MRAPLPFFGLFLSLTAALFAGPPFLTGDPDIVETKHLEIIPGWVSERRTGERVNELPAFELNYGLLPNVEVGYEAAWISARASGRAQRSGYGNSTVTAKWRLLEAKKDGLDFAVSPAFEFRNPGSRSVRKGLVADENTLSFDVRAEKEAGDLAVGVSAGWSAPSKSDGAWNYGLIVRKDVAKKFSIGVELVGEAAVALDRSRVMVNTGARIVTGEDSQLLLGLGRELHNHGASRVSLRTYVGWQQGF
ncbi:MAG: hypothetical protein RLZZ15_3443 [Verrucomicrobiota bacterium]